MLGIYVLEKALKSSQNAGFHQYGAHLHVKCAVGSLLDGMFPESQTGRIGAAVWPADPPNLTAPNVFLQKLENNELYWASGCRQLQSEEGISTKIKTSNQEILNKVKTILKIRLHADIRKSNDHK